MRSEARIIDANANRASEGLRTLEDIARFALDNAGLSERAKRARHGLAGLLDALPLPASLRITVRDTPGDVGTGIRTAREGQRIGLGSVATAAAARTAQAVRTIEETAKSIGSVDPGFESLRYEIYEIERLVRTGLIPASPQWSLCVLITESLCRAGDWERVARAAIAGGADCLQLREKSLPDRELLARARSLCAIASEFSVGAEDAGAVSVVINDRPDIALLCGAGGVHVGQGDLSPAEVRAVAGAGMPVGVSTSSVEEARAVMAAGASSVGLGPMFPTTTKRKDAIAGPEYLRAFLADEDLAVLPHLCIGGISTSNAGELVAVGARGLAVSSAVCGADDPEEVCRALRGIVDAGRGA